MRLKLLIFLCILAALAAFFAFDLQAYFSLDFFAEQRQHIEQYQAQHPLLVISAYFLIYVVVTALSLPGAAVMTLIGGALFGLGTGLLLVSFASTIGATLAFLIARTLLRDWVQQRFADRLQPVNQGVAKDGAFYLFTLRLVPIFPFFVINMVMALTTMRAWTFYWVSQLGMLAGTAVYVNAGTQLAQIESTADILSPGLLLSFVLLGLFPWLARGILQWVKTGRLLRQFKRPKGFDTNLIVIGAGSAGLVTAYIAAAVKAKVTLIEKHRMGGDCLNTGCVPSKALIRSSRIRHYIERSQEFGIEHERSSVDFSRVMQRVHRAIAQIEPHDSVERYTELGVDCVSGEATLLSPWEVKVGNQVISARHIVIASGARPAIPQLPGLDPQQVLTSDTLWQLDALPSHLVVLGGGPIGCELAQAFVRLGAQVSMIVRSDILPSEDRDVADEVKHRLQADGISLFTGSDVLSVDHAQQSVQVKQGDREFTLDFSHLLVATGRRANTEGLGLEKLGIAVNADGTVQVDSFLRTDCPTVYACGDVAGPYQFTHVAAHQAWYAAVNALFGSLRKFKVDYRVIPRATFTDPEVARVGLNEREARERNIAFEVVRYGIDDLDRAIVDGEAHGFIKVLTVPGKDKILGVTIVGYHASELLAEYVLAMKHGLGLNKVLGTIHSYPTLSEANKYVAGQWKHAHKPEQLLDWVKKFHRWRRR